LDYCLQYRQRSIFKLKDITVNLSRRTLLQISTVLGAEHLFASLAQAADWSSLEAEARGQEVFFNAWAGADTINAYIAWAGEQVKARYGVTLTHVKITDTAEVVKRVRDEVSAGKNDGSVDLVWINGENFRTMKTEKLLFGPFANALPNFALVDVKGKPTVLQDFTEKVEGLESPWGMAQFTFFGDSAKISSPPKSMIELADFAKANQGRVTYPAPPDFHGDTFLKQALVEVTSDRSMFGKPITPENFAELAKPWLAFLDEMRPSLWREGKQYPKSQAEMTQMVADGELLVGLTFNPNEPANLVAAGTLPKTTISWQHAAGTIGNSHFLAIPINARAKAAAQIVANFLLSPEAQARKNDLKIWGDPTVLDITKLTAEDAKLFTSSPAPGSVTIPGPAILEPDASFVTLIEQTWLERYGKG
jgi:putative thiamine transport system substrate-binding protein